jgi:hypothetical protein
MGNGYLGVMAWGTPERFYFSVNRHDVWDYRCPAKPVVPGVPWKQFSQLVATGNPAAIDNVPMDEGRTFAYPSLQLCGDLIIELASGELWSQFEQRLSLETGQTTIAWNPIYNAKGGPNVRERIRAESFVAADDQVLVVRLPSQPAIPGRKIIPSYRVQLSRPHNQVLPAPQYWAEGSSLWMELLFPDGFRYVLTVSCQSFTDISASKRLAEAIIQPRNSGPVDLMLTVATSRESDDPEQLCRRRIGDAHAAGWDQLQNRHRRWWNNFWSTAWISLDDQRIEQAWYFGMYMLAAGARADAMAMGLQAIWNRDNVPAWNSDYHLDTNVQLNYWPAYVTGHLDLCLPLYKLLADDWHEGSKILADYHGTRGVKLPLAAGPDGMNLSGFFEPWPGVNAWMGQHFLWHWRYSSDTQFLRKYYPYLKELALYYEDYLTLGDDGRYHVIPDASPEQLNHRLGTWGQDSTVSLSLIRCFLSELSAAASSLGTDPKKQALWNSIVSKLADYPTEDGHWIDLKGKNYKFTHRHTSRLFPIHPCGEIGLASEHSRKKLALASYSEFVSYNTEPFGAFSSVLLSAITARLGLPEETQTHLRRCIDNFTPSNLLNIADGNNSSTGFLQVEANLGFPYSVCESLLQSHDGYIRLFPATMPGSTCEFHGLQAMGAFRVSASMARGKCLWVEIYSLAGNMLKMINPFSKEQESVIILPTETGKTYRFP